MVAENDLVFRKTRILRIMPFSKIISFDENVLFILITSYRVKNKLWNQNPYVKKE